MPLDLVHLDPCTRRFMLAELEIDVATGTLYLSPQLSESGLRHYPRLLRAAILAGTDASFADALSAQGAVRPPSRWQHPREVGAAEALVDVTVRLAERELHRFYLRGLCCRALEQGVPTLVIYRARPADPGRTPADAMIGVRIDTRSLLEDLRGTFRSLPPYGLPQCRDPGLSARLPDDARRQSAMTDRVEIDAGMRQKAMLAERDSGSVASALAAFRKRRGFERSSLAAWLRLSPDRLVELTLERLPDPTAPDHGTAIDELAGRYGADSARLAEALAG